jgi:hypothetical protein
MTRTLFSEDKWDWAKNILLWVESKLDEPDGEIEFKRLEPEGAFLIYGHLKGLSQSEAASPGSPSNTTGQGRRLFDVAFPAQPSAFKLHER